MSDCFPGSPSLGTAPLFLFTTFLLRGLTHTGLVSAFTLPCAGRRGEGKPESLRRAVVLELHPFAGQESPAQAMGALSGLT